MAQIPSKKADLKAFLKARGVGETGDRKTLLNLARLYVNRPVVISGTDLAIAPEQTFLLSHLPIATATANAFAAAIALAAAIAQPLLSPSPAFARLRFQWNFTCCLSGGPSNLLSVIIHEYYYTAEDTSI